jgi:hypothetical protein
MRTLVFFAGVMCAATSAQASETITYSYDALGRLIKVSRAGTVNNGANACYNYDPANNRTNVNSAPNANCTSGGGGGGGGGGNQPPVAVPDSGSQATCSTGTWNVIANDTDPEGDYPLTLTTVSGIGFSRANSTDIQFTSGAGTGNKFASYTVTDSRGASSDGTLTINVFQAGCQ